MENENTKHAAMTPRTQSVCKCVHCEKSVYFEGNYWLLQSPATGQKYEMCAKNPNGRHEVEPVAEPASTGEQPSKCTKCGGNLVALPTVHCPKCASTNFLIEAARPSEPSAPPCDCSAGKNARLYEHHRDCHWLQFVTRPENNPAAPQTSAQLACQKCVEDIHGHCSGDCECRLSKCNLKVSAPQPVSGDAPEFPFNWPALPTRKRLNHDECGHANITRTVIFEYIDGPNHNGWMCQDCGTEFTPKLAGDAPKVEAIIDALEDLLTDCIADSDNGTMYWTNEGRQRAEAILRPYFPPASQTPTISDRPAIEAAVRFIEKEVKPRRCDNDGLASCVRCNSVFLAAKMRELLATPASTARTDGPSTGEVQHKLEQLRATLFAREEWICEKTREVGVLEAQLAEARMRTWISVDKGEKQMIEVKVGPWLVTYDEEAEAGYLYLFPGKRGTGCVEETVEAHTGINIDFTEDGTPLGIEVFGIFKRKRGVPQAEPPKEEKP